jgi:L-2-hydroxyglutarate oxidase LhgO
MDDICMTATDFDVIVIGAGVVGLAVARELAQRGRSVLAVEKAIVAGTETSSRNSEVIHAGIYYPQGSLKARLCVMGRERLYDFCASHGVAAKRIGKLIVAGSPEEEAKLQSISALASANGVEDLQWLSASDARALEPEVMCTRALFSPSTGIVDSHGLMLALQGEAETQGASFAFDTLFVSARRTSGTFTVTARGGDGTMVDVTCAEIVNCAGHGAHAAAAAVEAYPRGLLPPQHFARGHYCSVSGRSPFTHLVYPVPVSGALGIHATLDLAGAVRFGPDIQWIDSLDYSIPDEVHETFTAAIRNYWPGIAERMLTPSSCGIRPKIHGPAEGFADFLIQEQSVHGVPGLVNLFGIESPGLTASLATAAHVAGLLRAS